MSPGIISVDRSREKASAISLDSVRKRSSLSGGRGGGRADSGHARVPPALPSRVSLLPSRAPNSGVLLGSISPRGIEEGSSSTGSPHAVRFPPSGSDASHSDLCREGRVLSRTRSGRRRPSSIRSLKADPEPRGGGPGLREISRKVDLAAARSRSRSTSPTLGGGAASRLRRLVAEAQPFDCVFLAGGRGDPLHTPLGTRVQGAGNSSPLLVGNGP